MANLSVQTITLSAITPSFTTASFGGDQFANSGYEFLWIKNSSGSSVTVTIDSQTPCNQGYDHNVTVTVPAGQERVVGPFQPGRFNDANGNVKITYSSTANVTVGVFKQL